MKSAGLELDSFAGVGDSCDCKDAMGFVGLDIAHRRGHWEDVHRPLGLLIESDDFKALRILELGVPEGQSSLIDPLDYFWISKA